MLQPFSTGVLNGMNVLPRIDPRILVPVVACAGLVTGALSALNTSWWSLLLPVPLLLGGALVAAAWRRVPLIRSLFLLTAAFLLGLAQARSHHQTVLHPLNSDGAVAVTGIIRSVLPGGWKVCPQGRSHACAYVRLTDVHNVPAFPGDLVTAWGHAAAPRPPLNPFDFDEEQYVTSLGMVVVLSDVSAVHARRNTGRLVSARISGRRGVAERIDRRLMTEESRAIMKALLLGDRSDIPEDTRRVFSDSGLAHVLAVSGLHVSFVAVILLFSIRVPFRRMRVPERTRRTLAGAVSAMALLVFGWWIGPAASVDRAVFMGAALLLASAVARSPSPWIAFWWALLAALWAAPNSWTGIGLQLSFGAVGAILVMLPWLSRYRRRPFISALIVTGAAWLGTAPLLAFHFGAAPLAGAVLSPVAVPLMAPMLLFGAASLVEPGTLSVLIVELLNVLLHVLAKWGAAWPDWTRMTSPPGVPDALLIWPWMLIWLVGPALPRTRLRRTVVSLWLAGLTLLTAPEWRPPLVTQLHVGQGDATLIMVPGGRTLVVDSGPSPWSGTTIARHLRAAGRTTVDVLIHSHEHADHTGGTSQLAAMIPIKSFVGQDAVRRGDMIDVGPSARLYVLSPSRFNHRSLNDRSVVLRLQVGNRSFLFMGDAELPSERSLVRFMSPFLMADVVKVGHHGSASSSSSVFVDRTGAETAVISSGLNNRFRHPDAEVVWRWTSAGADVHITSRDGAWLSDQ